MNNAMPDIERNLEFVPVHNDRARSLSPAQIRQYNDDGFIFPLDVYSSSEAQANRDYFGQLMEKAAAAGHNSYSINGWHRSCAAIHDMITNGRILDYVQDLLGENLVCWGSHFFNKTAGDDKQVSWHQDASYWPLTPSKTVTVWLAIDDVDTENGGMEVLPGSHLHGQIPFERSDSKENNVLNQTVHNAESYGRSPVLFAMKAGQMSLHTDLLLHGSQPNHSQRRRCGLTMRFVPPDVRAYQGWNRGVICRGRDDSGHWQPIPRPDGETIPAAAPTRRD